MACHTDPGYHGMDRGEVSAAGQAAVYTGTRQVTSVAHTHGEEVLSGLGRLRGLGGKRHAQPDWDRGRMRRWARKLRGWTSSTYIARRRGIDWVAGWSDESE